MLTVASRKYCSCALGAFWLNGAPCPVGVFSSVRVGASGIGGSEFSVVRCVAERFAEDFKMLEHGHRMMRAAVSSVS